MIHISDNVVHEPGKTITAKQKLSLLPNRSTIHVRLKKVDSIFSFTVSISKRECYVITKIWIWMEVQCIKSF